MELDEFRVSRRSTMRRRSPAHGLARAALRARYLLLDEPAAGTSLPEREKLAVLLRDLAADEGLGILLVEHDLGLVGSVCARVVVLQEGRVVYGGAAEGWTRDRAVRSAYLGERHAGR